jgi:hypothetical protein
VLGERLLVHWETFLPVVVLPLELGGDVCIFSPDSVAILSMCYLVAHRPLGQCYIEPRDFGVGRNIESRHSLFRLRHATIPLLDTLKRNHPIITRCSCSLHIRTVGFGVMKLVLSGSLPLPSPPLQPMQQMLLVNDW